MTTSPTGLSAFTGNDRFTRFSGAIWEPAKWVAKLRELKTDDHLLCSVPTWTQAMAVNLVALNRTRRSDGICFSGRAGAGNITRSPAD